MMYIKLKHSITVISFGLLIFCQATLFIIFVMTIISPVWAGWTRLC